ncbi:MAG: CPBP family intramembrane metalloprotease [Sphingobacteriaceae bacterium]|nr:CPBP family intramembrane metalloprotease [Sphingobacteriaceae bacterium]
MALIVIVNSFFEELLLIGYLFKRFEKLHPALIILISSIIRASFHTYLGWQNLPSVFILALIFGLYYTRQKKLWPIIIAHAIGNIFYFFNENYNWIEV